MSRHTPAGEILTGGLFDIQPDTAVHRTRAAREQAARESAAEIEESVAVLARVKAVSPRRWRQIAHALHARHIYTQHVAPFDATLTYAEMAVRLNRIGIPRFRRGAPWSAQSIAEIRKTVAALRQGEILLPDS